MSRHTHIGIGEIKKARRQLSETPRHAERQELPIRQPGLAAENFDHEQETVSLINESFSNYDHSVNEEGGQLSIDVLQNDEEIVLIAATAGLNKNELEVLINDETLTIRGKRQFPLEKNDYQKVTEECFWGNFSRHIILPKNIDRSGIRATYKKCILIITIPKIDDLRSKVIRIT